MQIVRSLGKGRKGDRRSLSPWRVPGEPVASKLSAGPGLLLSDDVVNRKDSHVAPVSAGAITEVSRLPVG